MKVKVNFEVNFKKYELEFDEKDEMETLHKAIVLSNPRTFCNVCQDPKARKRFISNKDKEGNIYVNVGCGCGAKSKLGQYKAGGYFWREYEKFEGKKNEES